MAETVATNNCILLFGMPRSGTTWLGKLFDSHPHVLYRHEPDSWQPFSWTRYPNVADTDKYASEVQAFVAQLPAVNALRVVGKQPSFPKATVPAWRFQLQQASVNLARVGSRLHRDFPVFVRNGHVRDPQGRVVWKSIESLGRLGVILGALQQSQCIHIMRHPCGSIASMLRGQAANQFTSAAPQSEDYGIFKAAINTPLAEAYDLRLDCIEAMTPEQRLAWQWVLINEKAWLEASGNPRYMPVCYEDVCDNPQAAVERMFAFTGLDMNDQTKAFIRASTAQDKQAYYSVFKNPKTAAWRWREELDTSTVKRIMAIVEQSRVGRFYLSHEAAAEHS